MASAWEALHPEILQASREIANAGKFDDAIFAAFRCVEAEIQNRIGSAGIGGNLLDEAFDGAGPKIDISPDPRDRAAIKQLFLGALGNIRNDRGHKKAPLTPCKSEAECLLYLQFATLLLTLLDKDRNTFPSIVGVRVYGSSDAPLVEIKGQNFGNSPAVIAGTTSLRLNRVEPHVIEAALPTGFAGDLKVIAAGKESESAFCDVRMVNTNQPNSYRVIAVDLPLYSDQAGKNIWPDAVGMILAANEGGFEFLRIVPTYRGRYSIGEYVTHGPFDNKVIADTWYRPPNESRLESAWSSSLIATPKVIGHSTEKAVGGISIRPSPVRIALTERRALRAAAWVSEGVTGKEIDISGAATWSVTDPRIAYVNKSVLLAKALGRTDVECRYEQFIARTSILVEHIPQGESVIFFQGLNRLQQIRLDEDGGLFVCNQSPSVFYIGKDGTFSTVLQLAVRPTTVHAISCIAVDQMRRLYVNDLSRNACHRFEWDGAQYVNGARLAGNIPGSKQSIATNDKGQIFIALMGPHTGWIARIDPDGSEAVFPTRYTAIHLALDKDDHVYVSNAANRSIDVFDLSGRLIEEMVHGEDDSVSDLARDPNGDIYVALFRSGRIRRLSKAWRSNPPEYVPGSFGTPGGIALAPRGRIYVSNFAGNEIFLVY